MFKRIFAIIMVGCLMASMLCVSAFAADATTTELPKPAAGTVLRITAIKSDSVELVGDHTNFEDGRYREYPCIFAKGIDF